MAGINFPQTNIFQPPPLKRGTTQFGAQPNVPTLPSVDFSGMGTDPMSVYNASLGGSGLSRPSVWGDAMSSAAGGAGDYMQQLAAAKAAAQQQNTGPQNNLSGLVQRQGENAQSTALSVLNQSPAGYDIDPYAQMALKRTLLGAYSPISAAGGGFDLSKLQPTLDQFYSPQAIRSSMQQQQELRNNVDPDTPQSTAGLQIYGPDYQSNYDASTAGQGAAKNRRDFSVETSQKALRDAIAQNNKNAKGSIWAALGSALLKAAPMIIGGM